MTDKIRRGTVGDRRASKTITFTGAAGLGAVGDVPLFTVTGAVLITSIVPFCTTNLVENGATTVISLGATGQVALFIANSEPEDIDADEVWQAVAPADVGGAALVAALQDILVFANILITVVNDTVTGGTLEINAYWRPLSSNGLVVPA